MNKKFKGAENRIRQILSTKFSDISRRKEALDYYKAYLAKELK
jgi:hypothetical protein